MNGLALRQLSVNGAQLVLNQLFGVGIFYLLSVQLSKQDFGRVNLALAILLGLYSVLSMGMDSLAVKKAAAGGQLQPLLTAYVFHVVVTGFSGFLLLCLISPWLPRQVYPLLPLLGLGKLFLFFSTPYKQIVSGREKFSLLARMSLLSNGIRCSGLFLLLLTTSFTLQNAVILFIAGDLTELIANAWLYRSIKSEQTELPVDMLKTWFSLLREAAPQAAVVLITSLLARFDWICLGFLSSAGRLAEYSFAYKAFEMAQLPLLIIAPLLLPRFTRFFLSRRNPPGKLLQVLKAEIIVAAGSALLLQAAWVPFIDGITGGRYGAVNRQTISILCCCLPLIYVNNFLWTAWFAEGRLRSILYSFIFAAVVDVAGCLWLIPVLGNAGAALAFLLSAAAQTGWYLFARESSGFSVAWKPLCLYGSIALAAGLLGQMFANAFVAFLVSGISYAVLISLVSPLPVYALKNLRHFIVRYATRQPANP